MSEKSFQGCRPFNRRVAGRTKEALLDYVRREATRLGITPNAGEITGGPFLSKRFGGWRNVVAAAGLPQPRRQKPIASRQIFREEFKRQMKLYAQELQAGERPGENSKP